MKILILLLTALILSGCVSQPSKDAPDWDVAALPPGEVTDPLALPLLCPFEKVIGQDGETYGGWLVSCINTLDAYEDVAEGNTTIATLNASALRDTEAAYHILIQTGKLQQEMSEYYKEELKEEKKEHWFDNMIHKGIILLIGVGAAL